MPKQSRSKNIRGQKVILGRDLASIYGVQTKAMTQAVKRNAAKFPADFMFQLTLDEATIAKRLRSQNCDLETQGVDDSRKNGAVNRGRTAEKASMEGYLSSLTIS